MKSEWIVWLFEGIVLLAALAILITRSVFHAGLYLLVVVISIGVLFALYGSEFFFISQVMVYGGGILILILFATMITEKKPNAIKTISISVPMIIVISAVIMLMAIWVMAIQPIGIPYVIPSTTLGKNLLLEYSLPLEVAGILLLVSLIGAAITAIQKPNEA